LFLKIAFYKPARINRTSHRWHLTRALPASWNKRTVPPVLPASELLHCEAEDIQETW
jgi:hypothetical protein